MDAILVLVLVLGVPVLSALFLAREARLYRERELARRAGDDRPPGKDK